MPSLPPASLLRSLSHYLPSFRVRHLCCLSTFSGRIFSLLCVVLYCTDCSALLHNTFLTLGYDLLTINFSSLLAHLFSLYVMFSLCSYLPRFFITWLHSDMLQSYHYPQLCLLRSALSISDLTKYDWYSHAMICLLRYSWIRLLRSALSFFPLDLLIYLKITHH